MIATNMCSNFSVKEGEKNGREVLLATTRVMTLL